MKPTLFALVIAFAFAADPAIAAAPAGHEAGAEAHTRASAAPVQAVGIVRKVDVKQGKVTLQHEPIESLGWPAMVMAFKVSDPKLLQGLEPGRKVRFAFVQRPGGYVITAIE